MLDKSRLFEHTIALSKHCTPKKYTEINTWEKVAIPATNCKDIQIVGGSIFVMTQNFEIFLSRDNGNSWIKIPQLNQLINQPDLTLRIIDNIIFAGTYDQGLWKLDLNSLTSVDEEHIADKTVLSPNPAADILYVHSPTSQASTGYITTILGEKVHEFTLTQTGTASVQAISLEHLPNGLYIVHIGSTTQPIIVTK